MTETRDTATTPPDGVASAGDGAVVAPAREPVREPAPPDWRDGLPAGLPAGLRRVAAKFATPEDALRSYAALERRLGRSIPVPAEDAPADEIAAFHERLGRPADPAGYELHLPPDVPGRPVPGPADIARFDGFLSAMHAAGAATPVVQAAVDWYAAATEGLAQEERSRRAAAREEAEAALRRDWGEAFGRKLALARRAARHFGGGDLAGLLDESGLGDDPAWLRAFARIGEEMAEDALLAGGGGEPGTDAQARIDAIVAAHFGKPSYHGAGVQRELRALYRELYGTGAPGPDGPQAG